jgi:hypothetical protein
MGFGINAYNAKRVMSYEDCVELFKAPANLRRMGWGADKRPLDGVRKTHMRVERGPDDTFFDVMLFRTAMARYYKPETIDGHEHREIWYNVHGSQSSSKFQRNVLGFDKLSHVRKTTTGTKVIVGMNPEAHGVFPVRLYLVDGKVWVDRSRDSPAKMASTTSTERKEERKAFRKWLRPYEAMSKIVGDGKGALYMNLNILRLHYKSKELFDPTTLCEYITRNGVAQVVDKVFPLGNVENYNPSLKDAS